MMKLELLRQLGFSQEFQRLVDGKIPIPSIDITHNAANSISSEYYYPPMLIPTFVDYSGPTIRGILVHPFSKIRVSNPYVTFYLEGDYMLEMARNEKQFISLMVLQMSLIEEEITPEIIEFCTQMSFKEYREIDRFGDTYEDTYENYRYLAHFDEQRPLNYCTTLEEYNGDFVSSERLLNSRMLPYSSTYEVANRRLIETSLEQQPWFDSDSISDVFRDYLDKKEYEKAWLALNSHGWNKEMVIESLEELAAVSQNSACKMILDCYKGY